MSFFFLILSFFFLKAITIEGSYAAASANLAPVYQSYFSKNYKVAEETAIKFLQESSSNSNTNTLSLQEKGELFYLLGLSTKAQEKFELSIGYFKKAQEHGFESPEIFYELGQCEYAMNQLKESISSFEKSLEVFVKVPSSLYYIGHIYQIFEEHEKASSFYEKLVQHPETDSSLRQVGHLQLAEIAVILGEEKKPPLTAEEIEKNIFPLFKKVIELGPTSGAGTDAEKRLESLKKKYHLHPDYLINGKKIPEKKFRFSFSQKLKYDSNLNSVSELPVVQPTQKDTFLADSSFSTNYDYYLAKRFVFTPSAKGNIAKHSEQNDPSIYGNDNYSLNTNLKLNLEHTALSSPATLGIESGITYNERDITRKKRFAFSSRVWEGGLSYAFKLLSKGNTSLKTTFKYTQSYLITQESRGWDFSLSQTYSLSNSHLLVGLLLASFTEVFNTPTSSSDNYIVRFDYIIPNITENYTLGIFHSLTITDPKLQRETRGIETTFNPGLNLTRSLGPNLRFVFGYSYSEKNSKDKKSYAYKKHVTTFDFSFNF